MTELTKEHINALHEFRFACINFFLAFRQPETLEEAFRIYAGIDRARQRINEARYEVKDYDDDMLNEYERRFPTSESGLPPIDMNRRQRTDPLDPPIPPP